MAHTPQSYTSKFYTASISVATTSGTAHMSGLADIELEKSRNIGLWKPLDASAPVIVFGKTEGKLTLHGLATTAITNIGASSTAAFGASATSPASVTATFTSKAHGTTGGATSQYVGYLTGAGLRMRQISPRVWVMDGTAIINLVS
jgi:hypothetical protein